MRLLFRSCYLYSVEHRFFIHCNFSGKTLAIYNHFRFNKRMTILLVLLGVIIIISIIVLAVLLSTQRHAQQQRQQAREKLIQLEAQRQSFETLFSQLQQQQQLQQKQFDAYQIKSLQTLQESLQKSMQDVRSQITLTLNQHTQIVNDRLKEISGEVDRQLAKGFEKTTNTFGDVMKRLTIIDQAQKKITELSGNVVSLQEILNDKRSRGAFGEVQLNNLIRNILPENNFALQHNLSNGKRVDCILFLPEPTGNVSIDAKFPLETYRLLANSDQKDAQHHQHEQQFRQDIRRHVQDIQQKYIVPGETADGAMMFIPSESIFAEIHAHFPELVEYAHQNRVWLVSPTTMMAILTTARAVLKDAATRKQVHIIQEHLVALSKDFDRFQQRMDNLSRHIGQANQDVELVHRSSQKISNRFQKIEKVELVINDTTTPLVTTEDED